MTSDNELLPKRNAWSVKRHSYVYLKDSQLSKCRICGYLHNRSRSKPDKPCTGKKLKTTKYVHEERLTAALENAERLRGAAIAVIMGAMPIKSTTTNIEPNKSTVENWRIKQLAEALSAAPREDK